MFWKNFAIVIIFRNGFSAYGTSKCSISIIYPIMLSSIWISRGFSSSGYISLSAIVRCYTSLNSRSGSINPSYLHIGRCFFHLGVRRHCLRSVRAGRSHRSHRSLRHDGMRAHRGTYWSGGMDISAAPCAFVWRCVT